MEAVVKGKAEVEKTFEGSSDRGGSKEVRKRFEKVLEMEGHWKEKVKGTENGPRWVRKSGSRRQRNQKGKA